MKFQTDEWVIYDMFRDNPLLSKPQRAIVLHVYSEKERRTSMYDYEIYIDSFPGEHKKAREKDLHPISDYEDSE